MVKNLSLTFDETSALLEMSISSMSRADGNASASALTKLAYLYREFAKDSKTLSDMKQLEDLPRAA